MADKSPKHGNRQGYMTSPRSGAQCPVGQPGVSGNPRGSSLKARARSALKKILTEAAFEDGAKNMIAMAADSGHGSAAVAAYKLLLERALGPVGPQGEVVVTVRTEIGFAQPTDGRPVTPPMRAPKTEDDAPRMVP